MHRKLYSHGISSFFLFVIFSLSSLFSDNLPQNKKANIEQSQHVESAKKKKDKNSPAMNGICPVCLFDMHVFVQGVKKYKNKYKDKLYWFSGKKQLKLFQNDPERYTSQEASTLFLRKLKELEQRMKQSS